MSIAGIGAVIASPSVVARAAEAGRDRACSAACRPRRSPRRSPRSMRGLKEQGFVEGQNLKIGAALGGRPVRTAAGAGEGAGGPEGRGHRYDRRQRRGAAGQGRDHDDPDRVRHRRRSGGDRPGDEFRPPVRQPDRRTWMGADLLAKDLEADARAAAERAGVRHHVEPRSPRCRSAIEIGRGGGGQDRPENPNFERQECRRDRCRLCDCRPGAHRRADRGHRRAVQRSSRADRDAGGASTRFRRCIICGSSSPPAV